MWYFLNPARYQSERNSIADLAATSDWLTTGEWRLEGLALTLDCEIALQHRSERVTLKYGAHFPVTPPSVVPHSNERLSPHQYGAGGELCLSIRPDNWLPEYTGAMMLESAYQLLSIEEPNPETGEHETAPEAYTRTDGQLIRFKTHRAFLTAGMAEQLRLARAGAEIELRDLDRCMPGYRYTLSAIRLADGAVWAEPDLPIRFMSEPFSANGIVVQRGLNYESLPDDGAGFLAEILGSEYSAPAGMVTGIYHFLLVCPKRLRLFMLYKGKAAEIPIIEADDKPRLPGSYAPLSEKRVAIVGCGSLGSKVAASLARAGVGTFVLVDDDYFTSDNIVRNELDWTAAGSHKVDALAYRIWDINGRAAVTRLSHRMGGHESNGSEDSAVSQLARADLIIDTTADEQAFNYCSAAATFNKKPMVWGRVYAGGVGGMVMRARPDRDPNPQTMRQIYLNWCRDRETPAPRSAIRYGVTTDAPHIADDADVGVIAMHIARHAIDTLVNTESEFLHSGYLIGLRKLWIFREPFDIWIIEVPDDAPREWGQAEVDYEDPTNKAIVSDLVAMLKDAVDRSQSDTQQA